jgi:DNA-directed RNA polymerase subunit RPC12/RpoP
VATVYVCLKCGAEDSISELLTVEAWRGVSIKADEEGAPKAVADGEREVEWSMADCYAFHCCECDRQTTKLEEAVCASPRVECRDCGFYGEPAKHPAECGGIPFRIDSPPVGPSQVALEIAA